MDRDTLTRSISDHISSLRSHFIGLVQQAQIGLSAEQGSSPGSRPSPETSQLEMYAQSLQAQTHAEGLVSRLGVVMEVGWLI